MKAKKQIKNRIKRLKASLKEAESDLKTLQRSCNHPKARIVDVPGDYYSKAYSYQVCPDCGKGEN